MRRPLKEPQEPHVFKGDGEEGREGGDEIIFRLTLVPIVKYKAE